MSVGWALTLLVLVTLIALAAASFFPNMLTAMLILLGIPAVALLHALIGSLYTVFAIALLTVFAALIHTIADTFRQMHAANRTHQRRTQPHTERSARRPAADRSRIAA